MLLSLSFEYRVDLKRRVAAIALMLLGFGTVIFIPLIHSGEIEPEPSSI